MPSGPAVLPSILGVETSNGTSREKRSETGSRKRAPARQRPPRGSRPSRQAAPVVRPDLQARYEDELGAVREAYPDTRVWRQDDGLWLLTRSSLLAGFQQGALFVTAISFANRIVRGWGFWDMRLGNPTWIGPRHTNFPDGSICAFEPRDGTWKMGEPVVELLDLYTLWALRHLHLQVFGRWPGQQSVRHPYERILELREDEHCGCGTSDKRYGECCREKDLARNRIADAVNFQMVYMGGLRHPPSSIVRFVREQIDAPRFSDLLN